MKSNMRSTGRALSEQGGLVQTSSHQSNFHLQDPKGLESHWRNSQTTGYQHLISHCPQRANRQGEHSEQHSEQHSESQNQGWKNSQDH